MPDSVSCRYDVIQAIFSRVSRYASAEATRKATPPSSTIGKIRQVSRASCASRTNRITIVPISVRDDWNSVTTPSETSESSASTSLVSREIRTPARLRE